MNVRDSGPASFDELGVVKPIEDLLACGASPSEEAFKHLFDFFLRLDLSVESIKSQYLNGWQRLNYCRF